MQIELGGEYYTLDNSCDAKSDASIYTKRLSIFEMKCEKCRELDDGSYVFSARVNTKGVEDMYGDIPTSYQGRKVYDIEDYTKHPVIMVDHINSAGCIAGKVLDVEETEEGLIFNEAILRPVDKVYNPIVKDAIQAFKDGYSKAFSISGKFLHEDKSNKKHLTTAKIVEVSLVGIGADRNALRKGLLSDVIQSNGNDSTERLAEIMKKTNEKLKGWK